MSKAKQRTIPAGEFKDRCLRIMDEVNRQGIAVTVTKRGKPLVRVVPVHGDQARESLRGTIVHEDEDLYSTGETWDADS